jgi:hypothetical protein
MHVLHITIFTKDGGDLFEPLAFLVGLASLNRCPISPTSWPLVGTTSFQEKVHWRRSASSVACRVSGDLLPRISSCAISLGSILKHLPYVGSIQLVSAFDTSVVTLTQCCKILCYTTFYESLRSSFNFLFYNRCHPRFIRGVETYSTLKEPFYLTCVR